MHAPDDGGAGVAGASASAGRGGAAGRGGIGGTAAQGGTGGAPTGTGGTGGGATGTAGNGNCGVDAGAGASGGSCGAMFNFETDAQGATINTGSTAFQTVARSTAFTFCGSGALAIDAMFSGTSGPTTKGEVLINLPGAPLDLTGKTITVHVASDPGCSTDLNLSLVLNTQAGPVYFTPAFPIRPVTNMWKTGTAMVTSGGAGGPGAQPASVLVDRLPGHDLRRRDRHPLARDRDGIRRWQRIDGLAEHLGAQQADQEHRTAHDHEAARPTWPARRRASSSAAIGSSTAAVSAMSGTAAAASSAGGSARGLSERVVTIAAAAGARAASIACTSLSPTIDTSSATRRPAASAGSAAASARAPSALCAQSNSRSSPTRSQRPGQRTASKNRDEGSEERAHRHCGVPHVNRPQAADERDDARDHRDRRKGRGNTVGELDRLDLLEPVDERDAARLRGPIPRRTRRWRAHRRARTAGAGTRARAHRTQSARRRPR